MDASHTSVTLVEVTIVARGLARGSRGLRIAAGLRSGRDLIARGGHVPRRVSGPHGERETRVGREAGHCKAGRGATADHRAVARHVIPGHAYIISGRVPGERYTRGCHAGYAQVRGRGWRLGVTSSASGYHKPQRRVFGGSQVTSEVCACLH